ncbi:MAG: response regulator [Planctomycetes bacterium]|nr:response regulator [Planctomycetota bacterium]
MTSASDEAANGVEPVGEDPRSDSQDAPSSAKGNYAFDVAVLVIDGDPSIGRLIEATLTDHEFQVELVSDPAQVAPTLQSRLFQVVVLDYVIPGLDSAELLKLVQETQPDASIIVVTAFPSVHSALECLRARTFDYITKPFQVDVLKQAVLHSLDSRGLLRLSEQQLRERLGAAIRERRKALGLTLSEVTKRSNVSLGYLSQIELGKNSASIETLYRICLGLRITVAELFLSIQGAN